MSHEGPHATSSTLLASLKDSTKFEGGWGFFDFGGHWRSTSSEGPRTPGVERLPELPPAESFIAGRVTLHVGWSRAILTMSFSRNSL